MEVSLGHTIVELPLVLVISAGVLVFLQKPLTNYILSLIGGLFLIFFGLMTFRDALKVQKIVNKRTGRIPVPFLTGIVLSAFNPYFIAWWIGIGAPLISEAVRLAGFFGIFIFYFAHVWLDYAWLISVASVSALGQVQMRIYRILLLILGIIIIYFGLRMIISMLHFKLIVI